MVDVDLRLNVSFQSSLSYGSIICVYRADLVLGLNQKAALFTAKSLHKIYFNLAVGEAQALL